MGFFSRNIHINLGAKCSPLPSLAGIPIIMGVTLREKTSRRTTDEWEARIGQQVRSLRERAGLTQGDLARRSNVSVGAVQNLEYGAGSRLATLIQVTRTLGRGSWLEDLAPPVPTSPMQLLEEREGLLPAEETESSQRRINAAGRGGADSDAVREGEHDDVSGS
jgi:transcriptional regulator with XRE-family HTH domain